MRGLDLAVGLVQKWWSSWHFVASSDSGPTCDHTAAEAGRQVGRQQLDSRQGTRCASGVSTQGHQGDPMHVKHASEE